jgi:hypothetical protein
MRQLIAALALLTAAPAVAQTARPAPAPPIGKQQVETYRIAPGKQAAFLRFVARCDEANKLAGLPPRQLFVHVDGANWDFLILQPYDVPADKQAALDAAWAKVGLPSGADFFLAIREFIADHEDTSVRGPTTAADYLATTTAH